jgi:hypothetical protein
MLMVEKRLFFGSVRKVRLSPSRHKRAKEVINIYGGVPIFVCTLEIHTGNITSSNIKKI